MSYLYDCEANHFVKGNGDINGLPHLMWHVTYQCALQCKFCFAKKRRGEVVSADLGKYVNKLKKLSVQKVDISGGEPLQYEFLKELCDELYRNKIYMTLTTRGIGISDNISWVVSNRNKFTRIIISLDVPDAFLQEKLSDHISSFKETGKFIQLLVEQGYKNVRINTVVTRYLLNDEILKKMMELIKRTGCREWCLIEPHPANKKDTFDQVAVTNKEFTEVVQKVYNDFEQKNCCKILVRYAANYAGYWVLYPEGILAKHTDCEKDTMEMDFFNTSSERIMQEIADSDIWIPEED